MNAAKYFWDLNATEQAEVSRILRDARHPRFLTRAVTLLLRCDRPKDVFTVLPKATFLAAWPAIRSYWIKRERQSDARDWWETLYEQMVKVPVFKAQGEPAAAYRKIGKMIRERRVELGLSQRQLAQQTRISQPIISKIEDGRKNITLFTLIRLCKILGIQTLHLN